MSGVRRAQGMGNEADCTVSKRLPGSGGTPDARLPLDPLVHQARQRIRQLQLVAVLAAQRLAGPSNGFGGRCRHFVCACVRARVWQAARRPASNVAAEGSCALIAHGMVWKLPAPDHDLAKEHAGQGHGNQHGQELPAQPLQEAANAAMLHREVDGLRGGALRLGGRRRSQSFIESRFFEGMRVPNGTLH